MESYTSNYNYASLQFLICNLRKHMGRMGEGTFWRHWLPKANGQSRQEFNN